MDSPEPHPSIAGSPDSPFIPGGFTHSTPPQDSLPFLSDSPGLSSLSPLTPLQSLSFPFTLEFPVSALVQSDHTPLLSLTFLFNQSVYLVKLNFDPPSSSIPLAPEASGASLLSPSLPVPVSLPLPAPVRPEATGPLPLPLAIPALAPISLPIPAINLVNPIQPPANPRQNLPIPMAQVPFQMPLQGTPNAPKFSGKTPSELPQYLEDIDLLGDAAVLDEVQKIKATICYAALDEAEVWQTLPEATANPADWADFVAAIKKLYPGCEGANRYCHTDIQYLVGDYHTKVMCSQDDLGEYTRKFTKFAAILIAI